MVMDLTEKILVDLDLAITFYEGTTVVRFFKALHRQVEKHTKEDGFYGLVCAEHSKDVDTLDQVPYPCTFITEVATDLGIEVEE
jgi:hypothetical protein